MTNEEEYDEIVNFIDENTPAEKRKILEIGIARITNNSRMRVK